MQSNQPPKAIQAREGFYFLDNDSNGVIAQITGQKQLTQPEIFNWRMVLETRHCWFAKHNIPYFYLAVPNKHCLYSEFLPDGICVSQNRPIAQILQAVKESFVSFLYPIEALASHKEKGLLYRLKDSHWTHLGAYHCYSVLAQQLLDSGVPIHKVEENEITFLEQPTDNSDLGIHFNDREDIDITATMPTLSMSCALSNGVLNTGNLQVWKNNNGSGLPRALVFRDSFCNQMVAFLVASFSEVAFVWQPNIDFKLVQEFNPDVVINQQVERFITTAPQDLFAWNQRQRQQKKAETKKVIQTTPVFKTIIDSDKDSWPLSEHSKVFVENRLTELLSDLAVHFQDSWAIQANYILDLLRANKATEAKQQYVLLASQRKDIPLQFHQLVRSRLGYKISEPETLKV